MGTGAPPTVESLLAFERTWRQLGLPKEQAIRRGLGISPTRYHQLLNRALDLRTTLELDPALVLRLRRLRQSRRAGSARATMGPPGPLG